MIAFRRSNTRFTPTTICDSAFFKANGLRKQEGARRHEVLAGKEFAEGPCVKGPGKDRLLAQPPLQPWASLRPSRLDT